MRPNVACISWGLLAGDCYLARPPLLLDAMLSLVSYANRRKKRPVNMVCVPEGYHTHRFPRRGGNGEKVSDRSSRSGRHFPERSEFLFLLHSSGPAMSVKIPCFSSACPITCPRRPTSPTSQSEIAITELKTPESRGAGGLQEGQLIQREQPL
jgi:hypothetical protein